MRVSLIAVDYGALAPLSVPRRESRVATPLDAVLRGLAGSSLLAVVTSMDYDYISKRVPYAHGWVCTGGLEVRLADGRVFAAPRLANVADALKEARSILKDGVDYEPRMGARGMLGFAIDWTGRPTPRRLDEAITLMVKEGISVVREPGRGFVDFFGSHPDRRAAISRIKDALAVYGSTMFLGDSFTDNPAFWQAEVPIGVDHGEDLSKLECEFVVDQQEVTVFLRGLAEAKLDFDPALPGIRRRPSLLA